MLELIKEYSVQEVIFIVILLALAIKETCSLVDWFRNRVKGVYDKRAGEETCDKQIKEQLLEIKESVVYLTDTITGLESKIVLLTESDREDIRAFIVGKHHYHCYELKWIDDFTLDTIEKRYGYYIKENGNSYVCGLMEELRKLPKVNLSQEE